MEDFDIIEYLSGLAPNYVFDKAVLKRIALDRGVSQVQSYDSLDTKTKDLLRADLLLEIYLSPNSSGSYTEQHGAFSRTFGSQTYNSKKELYNIITMIYKKYGDDKLEAIPNSTGDLVWIDENDYYVY